MRVVVVGPVYPYKGGISHYNSELCNHLSKIIDVQVISYSRAFPSWLYPGRTQKDQMSKNFFEGEAQFIFDTLNPLTWRRTAKRIAKFKPDALIFHWYTPYFSVPFSYLLQSLKKTKCRVIAICHNVLPHEGRLLDKPLTKLVFKHVSLFIVHSDEDYTNLTELIPNARVKKLFHPIYDLFYKRISKSKAKEILDLKGNVLLFFGFVRKYKGLEYLLRALPEVLKKMNVTLLVVGEFFEPKEKYLKIMYQLGIEKNVRIIDRYVPNEEVAVYFSAADLVVAPYISGTQSGVINVAYAFNKPVIASSVGGLSEIVKNNKTGYLISPRNSMNLAESIIRFYQNNEEKNFEGEIKKLKKQYSWEKLCRKIIQEVVRIEKEC